MISNPEVLNGYRDGIFPIALIFNIDYDLGKGITSVDQYSFGFLLGTVTTIVFYSVMVITTAVSVLFVIGGFSGPETDQT